MTDNSNNNAATDATSHGHLQDKLVKDSIANNQNITAQVKARQNHVSNTTLNENAAVDNNNNDFTQVQDLPTGTPQGQQTTMPNHTTNANATLNNSANPTSAQAQTAKQTLFNQRDDINNPHTPDTDGNEQTHFGYKTVNKAEKQARVADVFTSVAKKYDIMNDLMSFGIHRLWKRYAISLSGVRAGQHVLDIAGGTGDLAKVFSREVGRNGHVVLSDINAAMLEVGS